MVTGLEYKYKEIVLVAEGNIVTRKHIGIHLSDFDKEHIDTIVSS